MILIAGSQEQNCTYRENKEDLAPGYNLLLAWTRLLVVVKAIHVLFKEVFPLAFQYKAPLYSVRLAKSFLAAQATVVCGVHAT